MTAPPCIRFCWVSQQMKGKKNSLGETEKYFVSYKYSLALQKACCPLFKSRECWHLDVPHSWKSKVLPHAENCEVCEKSRNRIIKIILLRRRIILIALDNHINTVKSTWCPVKSTLKKRRLHEWLTMPKGRKTINRVSRASRLNYL